eukprot:364256_1
MPYVDKARISIVDICVNSGEVVSVFLFKQLVSIIKKPNKALVITTKPFIEYQNNKETVPTVKNIKNWRRATIVGWIVGLALCGFVNSTSVIVNWVNIALGIIFVLIILVGLCVLMIASSKFHWILNALLFALMIMYAVMVVFFRLFHGGILALVLLFGLTATYVLKVSEIDKANESVQYASVKQEKESEDVRRDQQTEQDHENSTNIVYMPETPNQIVMNNVKKRARDKDDSDIDERVPPISDVN